MNVDETYAYLDEYQPTIDIAVQYNFLDFHDTEQAFKGTAAYQETIVRFDGLTGISIYMPLVFGEVDNQDELINPISPEEKQINFLNTQSITTFQTDKTTITKNSLETLKT